MEIEKNSNSNGKLFVELVMRKYINGSDIKAACEQFIHRINADSNPEHKKANEERKRILNNCITLFDNPETEAQIEQIKQSEEFKDIFALMKRIITEFHLEIFGVNNQNVVEYVLRKYVDGADINALCSRLSQKISEDSTLEHSEENEECKKVLQNCLTLLQDPTVKEEIESIRQSENLTGNFSLVQRIKVEYFEKIFGKDKRKYDMSDKYIPSSIATQKAPDGTTRKIMDFRYVINDAVTPVQDGKGNDLVFEKVGRLAYQTQLRGKKYVDKYRIYKNDELLCEVFTKLSPSKLLSDEAYRRAVIKELLSDKNINSSKNNAGYIGEIQAPDFEDEKAPLGKQVEFEELLHSVSKYGYSELYDFVFDYNSFSAVKDYQQEQQQSPSTVDRKDGAR